MQFHITTKEISLLECLSVCLSKYISVLPIVHGFFLILVHHLCHSQLIDMSQIPFSCKATEIFE